MPQLEQMFWTLCWHRLWFGQQNGMGHKQQNSGNTKPPLQRRGCFSLRSKYVINFFLIYIFVAFGSQTCWKQNIFFF